MIDDEIDTSLAKIGYSSQSLVTREDALTLNRAPLIGSQAEYLSKIFNIHATVNPIVAAAAPLLTVGGQLRKQATPFKLEALHESLCHEIKAFESKAYTAGYRSQITLGARYMICTFIDEAILSTTWPKKNEWKAKNLLESFHNETFGNEKFFLMIERAIEDPEIYIDLLELAYLCLSLGFQGKYKEETQSRELAIWIDKLYDIIRYQRGEVSKQLLIEQEAIKKPLMRKTKTFPALLMVTTASVISLIAIFTTYYSKLNLALKPTQNAAYSLLMVDGKKHE